MTATYGSGVTAGRARARARRARGSRLTATVAAAMPATATRATAIDVRSAISPISGEASRKPRRAPEENDAIPLCEPWVRSLAARNSSGNSDDRPSPATNSPQPAAAGCGAVAATTTPIAASAAPPRRVRSRPRRSVAWSPMTRPTSMPPATATNPSPAWPAGQVEAVAHHQRRPVVRRQLGEGDRHPDEEQPDEHAAGPAAPTGDLVGRGPAGGGGRAAATGPRPSSSRRARSR